METYIPPDPADQSSEAKVSRIYPDWIEDRSKVVLVLSNNLDSVLFHDNRAVLANIAGLDGLTILTQDIIPSANIEELMKLISKMMLIFCFFNSC